MWIDNNGHFARHDYFLVQRSWFRVPSSEFGN
jgi:hypothetical protein